MSQDAGRTPLMDEKAAARFLSVSLPTIRRWRAAGAGPEVVRFGRCVRYTTEGLEAWVKRCTQPACPAGEVR